MGNKGSNLSNSASTRRSPPALEILDAIEKRGRFLKSFFAFRCALSALFKYSS